MSDPMFWMHMVSGAILAVSILLLIAFFISYVVLRACDQCGKHGAKKYVYRHSDGAPVTMQYCDECDAAISVQWKANRLIAALENDNE